MKPTRRKAFNFLRSYYDVVNKIPDDKDKLDFLLSILDKQFLDKDPEGLSFVADLAYESQRHHIEESVKGYKTKTKDDMTTPTQGATQGATKGGIQGGIQAPSVQEEEKEKEKEEEKEKVEYTKGKKTFPEEVVRFYNESLTCFPDHLHPKTDSSREAWMDTIDKIVRIDKVPLDVLAPIIRWAREDNFWSGNFMSLPYLRKKNKQGISYLVVFAEKMKQHDPKVRSAIKHDRAMKLIKQKFGTQ